MAVTQRSRLETANNLLISHQNTRENEMELEVIPSRFKRLKCLGKYRAPGHLRSLCYTLVDLVVVSPKRGVRGSNPPGDGKYKRELLAGTAE